MYYTQWIYLQLNIRVVQAYYYFIIILLFDKLFWFCQAKALLFIRL